MLLGLFGACIENVHMEEKKYSRVVGGKSNLFSEYRIQVFFFNTTACHLRLKIRLGYVSFFSVWLKHMQRQTTCIS